MPKKFSPLTDNQIKNIKPRERNYEIADGEGLYLRVHVAVDGFKPTKNWIFRYLKQSGKRTNATIGRYPQLSLSEAREIRASYLVLIEEGKDPVESTKLEKLALGNSLESVSRKWFELKRTKVTNRTFQCIVRRLERYVFTHVGETPISEITAPRMISVLSPLVGNNNLGVLKKICRSLNQIMAYAENIGLIEVNRISKISNTFPSETSRHLPSIGKERLPEFLKDV